MGTKVIIWDQKFTTCQMALGCDKFLTKITTLKAYPDKYEKDFNAVVTYLTQYINKRGPTPSNNVAFIAQTRPAKQQKISTVHGTFKGKIALKKYSTDEYNSMLTAQ